MKKGDNVTFKITDIKVGDIVKYDGNLATVKKLPFNEHSQSITIQFKSGMMSVVNKWSVLKMPDEFDWLDEHPDF